MIAPLTEAEWETLRAELVAERGAEWYSDAEGSS